MHWTAAQPGCLDTERELILIDQTPGEIIFLSAADTDLSCVSAVWQECFGQRLRIAHAFSLRQPVAADHYIETVVRKAKLIVARLLGGQAYFAHFIQGLLDLKEAPVRPKFLIFSGTGSDDEALAVLSDFPPPVCKQMFEFFKHGGLENMRRAAQGVEQLLANRDELLDAVPMPEFGIYKTSARPATAKVWLCFYRAWLQAGDLEVVDALFSALEEKGLQVHCLYSLSLRSPAAQAELLTQAQDFRPDVVVMMQSFSICLNDGEHVSFFEELDCPVLQVPVALCSKEAWLGSLGGLSPAEAAMNVALPEIDGRLFGTVIGFKEEVIRLAEIEFTLKRLKPDHSQISHVTDWVRNWASLRQIPPSDKNLAIILSNYPNRDGRIGNGVGLDTPASTVKLLSRLHAAGYLVEPCPQDGEELMRWLQSGITNDRERSYGKPCYQEMDREEFEAFLGSLPAKRRNELGRDWQLAFSNNLPVAGIKLGNVFVGIQPPRGYSLQPQAIYHSPTLPPPPEYLAFYLWIRETFRAHAVVHLGKHGNLEWLPGRSVALGADDYPWLCLGPLPHFYPFIVNNPGEGSQAKRRTAAVIVDHLTPPLTRAGLYGDLEKAERLLEEHAHCLSLYPSRATELEREISQTLENSRWGNDLPSGKRSVEAIGSFLCDIKESQIRSALHVLGERPNGEREVDFLLSLVRVPSGNRPGLLEALNSSGADSIGDVSSQSLRAANLDDLTAAERDRLEVRARTWLTDVLKNVGGPRPARAGSPASSGPAAQSEQRRPEGESEGCSFGGESSHEREVRSSPDGDLQRLRAFVLRQAIPRLSQCENELQNLLDGLNGCFVPPGPAGAPTRGRIDVLPTGRNFFSIDPRAVPTQTAWHCGKAMAQQLMERHRQENGEYPRKLALVVWGTSNMRTGGDDIAQALCLWGCEPVWEEVSGRVVDFRILPLSLLGRPRVDVLLRVSGLFRDAFGETMRLLATVPKRLAEQDEPLELNPIRESWLRDRQIAIARGIAGQEAARIAALRVFSSEPGAYGTGLLPLIDAGNWESKRDLVDVFCRWGGFAFDSDGSADEQRALFRARLSEIEVVHQNQDNREHDILDSDDYFQFQGGLHAAVEQLRGSAPATYHGDSSRPDQPRVRKLEEEIVRVIHSRVLNPRWIEAMRRHGYKGAFEMAATVDYLFGYGATTNLIKDIHYQEVARLLLLDPEQKRFFQRHNPAALEEATERLLEAAERGLWESPDKDTISALESNLLELQGQLE
jgi:cobaltochelatase CobN